MPIPTRVIETAPDEPQALTVPQNDPALLFERLAKDENVSVEKIERLMALWERGEARKAEAAFNAAFAEMQGELPTIVERGRTDKGKYARLEDIVDGIRPILRKHGFALSHRTEWPDPKTIKVIGILTHKDGHSRTSEFLSAADTSGSKNAIQALGSAVAYGRRYTSKDLLNIVTTDEDDDGRATGAAGKPDPPDGFEDWADNMLATADEGMAKLSEASRKSDPEYTTYALKHRRDMVDGWKARAKASDRKAAGRG